MTKPRDFNFKQGHSNDHWIEIGKHHRARIKEWFRNHPGANQKECAYALDIAAKTVQRHIREIRAEWIEADRQLRKAVGGRNGSVDGSGVRSAGDHSGTDRN